MIIDKNNINKNIITYLGLFIVLIVIIYFAYKKYDQYATSHTLYSLEDDNVHETLLINDWTSGNNISISPTNVLPQSMIPNEYSISFLIYLNDLQQTDTNIEQIIFRRGQAGDSSLTLSIEPLKHNPYSNLRFTCKLQVNVENVVDTFTNTNETVEPFVNSSSGSGYNSNRIHNKIGSNLIDYNTVQNIYSKETFQSISKESFTEVEKFQDTDINIQDINNRISEITDKIDGLEDIQIELEKKQENTSLTINIVEINKLKVEIIDINKEITGYEIDLNNATTAELNAYSTFVDEKLKEINTKMLKIQELRDQSIGSIRDEDYVELINTSTQEVFHVCMVMHDNIIDIYKNGMLISSKVLDSLPKINTDNFIFFPENTKPFNGFINNFAYFNKALNHEDVNKNYGKNIDIIDNTKRTDLLN